MNRNDFTELKKRRQLGSAAASIPTRGDTPSQTLETDCFGFCFLNAKYSRLAQDVATVLSLVETVQSVCVFRPSCTNMKKKKWGG